MTPIIQHKIHSITGNTIKKSKITIVNVQKVRFNFTHNPLCIGIINTNCKINKSVYKSCVQ